MIDININVEGLDKLAKTVQRAFGGMWEPTHIRRMAKAENQARLEMAKTDIEEAKIKGIGGIEAEALAEIRKKEIMDNFPQLQSLPDGQRDLLYRTANRVFFQEAKRQKNFENIIGKAASNISNNSGVVSDIPVDEDWVNSFFDSCQDVSDDQMQKIWSLILSGEIIRPKSFSRRTLAFVKTMERNDAIIFKKFCGTIWGFPPNDFIHIKLNKPKDYLEKAGLKFMDMYQLEHLGLISKPLGYSIEKFSIFKIKFGSNFYLLGMPDMENTYGTIKLSDIGSELFHIIDPIWNNEYRNRIIKSFHDFGCKIEKIEG